LGFNVLLLWVISAHTQQSTLAKSSSKLIFRFRSALGSTLLLLAYCFDLKVCGLLLPRGSIKASALPSSIMAINLLLINKTTPIKG